MANVIATVAFVMSIVGLFFTGVVEGDNVPLTVVFATTAIISYGMIRDNAKELDNG